MKYLMIKTNNDQKECNKQVVSKDGKVVYMLITIKNAKVA